VPVFTIQCRRILEELRHSHFKNRLNANLKIL
jgi:hypothetical protein